MILAGKKGKNTVQAFVIFRNFMDGIRSNVNQTSNDIKNARGVRRESGETMRRICRTKPKKEPTLYAKKPGSSQTRMGERVARE